MSEEKVEKCFEKVATHLTYLTCVNLGDNLCVNNVAIMHYRVVELMWW